MNRLKVDLVLMFCLVGTSANAQEFESVYDAVENMRIGWNLGNTLDSNSGDTLHMWMEWNPVVDTYETGWGQKKTTRALIHMFKEAGFNAIRVPVTWYPHMGIKSDGSCCQVSIGGGYEMVWYQSKWKSHKVDAAWMNRVKEIVDYVIDEGMYCILNVHHDTGTANTHWIIADEESYDTQYERFEDLWTQIATTFRDYGEHLLFEGYNEMTDIANSWCFASFAASGGYNAAMARSAYNAVNLYAQSFVDAVRATGGNNSQRNLVVSTYAACAGEGNWSSHLKDPLTNMKLPLDDVEEHIAFEVHSYPDISSLSSAKQSVVSMMKQLSNTLGKKAPVIIGEWGTSDGNDYKNRHDDKLAFSRYFVEQAKKYGIATFHWMGLSDGDSRAVPAFNEADLKDAIVKGYYGEGGYSAVAAAEIASAEYEAIYTLSGVRVPSLQLGINIVRTSDGKTRKVLVK